MGVKISELTSATSITGTEEVPIVQGGNTKKATVEQFRQTELLAIQLTSDWSNPSANNYNPIKVVSRTQVGSNFNIDTDGKINCLNDVKFLLNLNLTLHQGSSNANKFVCIRQNGTSNVYTALINTSGSEVDFTLASIYCEAQAGDYFEICFYSTSTADKIVGYRLEGTLIKIIPSGS